MLKTPSILILVLAALALPVRADVVNVAIGSTVDYGYLPGDGGDLTGPTTRQAQYPGNPELTLNNGSTVLNPNPANWGNSGKYGAAGYVDLQLPVDYAVVSLNFWMHVFGDGGWFGDSNNPLAGHLVTPVVQISIDSGVSWTTVASTSDYVEILSAWPSTQGVTPKFTLTLDEPQANINGIRIVGPNGGTAGPNSYKGFMCVTELEVMAEPIPEPTTLLSLLGGLGLLAIGRRFSRAR